MLGKYNPSTVNVILNTICMISALYCNFMAIFKLKKIDTYRFTNDGMYYTVVLILFLSLGQTYTSLTCLISPISGSWFIYSINRLMCSFLFVCILKCLDKCGCLISKNSKCAYHDDADDSAE